MSVLNVEFADHSKFSVIGTNWTARLGYWQEVPTGHLLLDAVVDEDGSQREVQLFCLLGNDGCLRHNGEWQIAPQ